LRKSLAFGGAIAGAVALFFIFTKEDQFGDQVFHVPFVVQIALGVVLGFSMIVALISGTVFRREIACTLRNQFEELKRSTTHVSRPPPTSEDLKTEPLAVSVAQRPNNSLLTLAGCLVVFVGIVVTIVFAIDTAQTQRLIDADRQDYARKIAEENTAKERRVPTQEHGPIIAEPPIAALPIPDFATTTTKAAAPSQWSVSVSREDGTVPASIVKREDVAELIGNDTCEGAKETTQEFYRQRAAQDRPVRMDMMEERMAVEFFACHPEDSTWSSDR
jgi:hypothetical protein